MRLDRKGSIWCLYVIALAHPLNFLGESRSSLFSSEVFDDRIGIHDVNGVIAVLYVAAVAGHCSDILGQLLLGQGEIQ